MSRLSMDTPCPAMADGRSLFSTQNGLLDDVTSTTTLALDYTRAFPAPGSLIKAQPKRKARHSVQFAIHDDGSGDAVEALGPGQKPCTQQRSSVLMKPARRISMGVHGSTSTSTSSSSSSLSTAQPILRLPPTQAEGFEVKTYPARSDKSSSRIVTAPRRPAVRLSMVPETSALSSKNPIQQPRDDNETITISRPARRRTIYIPNDATIPSMYMGIFSPLKECDLSPNTGFLPSQQQKRSMVNSPAIEADVVGNKGRRESIIRSAPRRAPLRKSMSTVQESAVTVDRPGQGDGKENVPPGSQVSHRVSNSDAKLMPIFAGSKSLPRTSTNKNTSSMPCKSSRGAPWGTTKQTALIPSSTGGVSKVQQTSKPAWNGGSRAIHVQTLPAQAKLKPKHEHKPAQCLREEVVELMPKPQSRLLLPIIEPDTVSNPSILLSNGVANPTLYEDNWLDHQEIVVTQLVNKIFTSAQDRHVDYAQIPSLTQMLLQRYDTEQMALLHRRLQAAVLYGSLSTSQDILQQAEGLIKDIGRRERFVSFWLDTYDRMALRAALEVVIGRPCHNQGSRISADRLRSGIVSRKTLQNFIETFLLRNEDGRPDSNLICTSAWSYHRTMVRSLMLVKVLDMSRNLDELSLSTCLFLPASPFKSSAEVLQSLWQMLNPSAGDPIRALTHIDFGANHVQNALQEVDFTVANLAVDLRDGIRLTRLIELMLYPTTSGDLVRAEESGATTTICMPAGESFDVVQSQQWPLSQHLKLPCQSRVAKIWNAQVALSAISGVKGMSVLLDGITAEDIVDGFREKSIRLLWALVGKCGLPTLLDWNDIAWESRRISLGLSAEVNPRGILETVEDDSADEGDANRRLSFTACKAMLRNWARLVARKHGLQITNFTTCFTDGRIFAAIVSEYDYLLTDDIDINTSRSMSLPERLIRLGCSQQFASLFSAKTTTHTFDRDFVLAALTFLASRLLTPTKVARAAIVIQRTWRQYWGRIVIIQRQQKKVVASACAELARAKGCHTCTTTSNRHHNITSELVQSEMGALIPADHFLANSSLKEHTQHQSFSSDPEDLWLSL